MALLLGRALDPQKSSTLSRRESLGDLEHIVKPGMLWIHTVSKEIVDRVSRELAAGGDQ